MNSLLTYIQERIRCSPNATQHRLAEKTCSFTQGDLQRSLYCLPKRAGLVQLVVDDGLIQVISLKAGPFDLLGWSQTSVIADPDLESKVRQGVTTEIAGEGVSPGPRRRERVTRQSLYS